MVGLTTNIELPLIYFTIGGVGYEAMGWAAVYEGFAGMSSSDM